LAVDVAPALDDPQPGVQVTAATTLGLLGGTAGVPALVRVVGSRRDWAVRREALLALARLDRTAYHAQVTPWANGGDWRDRATAAEGAVRGSVAELTPFLSDRDPRVVETALQAWAGAVEGPDPELVAAARAALGRPDPMVRSVSADILGRAAAGRDVPALVAAFHRARTDSFPDAALSALGALAAIAHGPDSLAARGFLTTEPAPRDPLLKAWAEGSWPSLADRWGPSRPIVTGRALDDYRALARRYLVGPDSVANPKVIIEIVDRGNVPVQLFGSDAPLTVANFLRLVDQHYFDGLRWHRVVPNFVVQTGDPRGDGSGGPGWAIRDEINRRRYAAGYVGMALSGPDTGGSQWFITLAPEPHLDGTYTIFGRITGGSTYLARVTQGDVIRSIHR
ncbi:MAG TPA: peptidylprolyl isomerase, partial [Gemmatimonadales bacterium]|nr:peptidylprolyl isomerase [Gemmatimonadales bacterium]